MGMITITTRGTFGNKEKEFSAMRNGHADAIAQAIEYLSGHVLPDATALDHKLHAQGDKPEAGFDRKA